MSRTAEQPTLLRVDDERSFCTMMADALQSCGYEVRIAHDAAAGPAVANADPPEFAVVDLAA